MVVLGGAGVHSHLRLLETLQDECVAVVLDGSGGVGGDVHAVLEPPGITYTFGLNLATLLEFVLSMLWLPVDFA